MELSRRSPVRAAKELESSAIGLDAAASELDAVEALRRTAGLVTGRDRPGAVVQNT